jgi:uncharacterized protein involved in type VI secretion and phage assembly
MALEMLESLTAETNNPDRRIYGVAVAKVISNTDVMTMGRVQIELPWLPDTQPWARVAVLMAGRDCGTYFIPQVDDEVLVTFHHGDIREPFVIGSLWNGQDQPPATDITDSIYKRLIHTPQGLELEFDDKKMSVVITIKKELQGGVGAASASGVPAGKADKDSVPAIVLDSKLIKLKRAKSEDDDEEEQVIKIDKDGITIKTKMKDEDKEREITLNKDGITIKIKQGDIALKAEQGNLKIEAERIEIKSRGDFAIEGHPIRLN